ncbi:kinase-associated lipoprotein B [Thalassobacillus sp. CUG 92003]|uniref:kinase-associated lipoprotein B n=1 Tax=Thalassobacillus sp. CUG 92003 TaxID=2736641 RepID=UPI0015E68AA2|nr:kinase-associated lipoprotein B [Thalassobacillus sp. CUG 92003]
MTEFKPGDIVKAHYKSGEYIGELIKDKGNMYLVQVQAVAKHPMQGDLHNPGETDNVFFHQRKALSYQEKMNVDKQAVHAYEEPVPEYETSLKEAVDKLKQKLNRRDTDFNRHALSQLESLETQYFS